MINSIDKFTDKATTYGKYRPKYPLEIIGYLMACLDLQNDSTIVDIGCGTGILTKELVDYGFKTIGIEPNKSMYNEAKKYLQNYDCQLINASAENTSLKDNSVDLITVAQALHWFNLDKFINEYRRILKNNGQVAIIYNNIDKSHEIISRYLNVQRLFCPGYNKVTKTLHDNVYTKMFGGVSGYTEIYCSNDQKLSYDEYIGYIESLSYSLSESDSNYTKYRNSLDKIFYDYEEEGKITLPTTTKLVLSKKFDSKSKYFRD